MPVKTYIGCPICLQPGAYDCHKWCKYQQPDCVEPSRGIVIEIVRFEGNKVKVRSTETKLWVYCEFSEARGLIYPTNDTY
jgi:hypothetical protein